MHSFDVSHGSGRGAGATGPVLLGVSGVARNACAAICVDGQIQGACEQERLTRVRGAGFDRGSLPGEAIDQVLALAGRGEDDVAAVVVAEPDVRLPEALPGIEIDHHRAHAATAFLTSAFDRAAVLVCDRAATRELSVWRGCRPYLDDCEWPWKGRAFATLHAECAALFGFDHRGQEHQLEALARLGNSRRADELESFFWYADGALHTAVGWKARLHEMVEHERCRGYTGVADLAAAVQRRIGDLLLEVCREIRAAVDAEALCLGGGLFFNTHFTTRVCQSGIFDDVFVPINPGNAGLAIGATMLASREKGHGGTHGPVSPFLGPAYSDADIKAALDSCKLSYAFVSESEAIDAAVECLVRGQLVGWFQGRMEWGHKALGHRSILANPCSPYALDNLNCFLRKRERWRPFGVSTREESLPGFLCGPPRSQYMEYEYGFCDDRLRHITPPGLTSVRVQTVDRADRLFWELHRRMEQAIGTGVLVNTSFNGFHEPIACSPRDAVRVFYGTGLDALVMGRFVLRK